MVFEIPSDFRAFMADVVSQLDVYEPGPVDGEDAFRTEVGNGGRIARGDEPGDDLYRFHYVTADGLYRWELELRERAIRSIADDMLIEIEGMRYDVERTKRRTLEGDPLLVWGEYTDDALRIRGTVALIEALEALHDRAATRPQLFRLWSAADDQIAGVVLAGQCALYVIESVDGYASSVGDRSLVESFVVEDHDGRQFQVPLADCIPWERARNAILSFIDHGHLGPEIAVENQIPSLLLYMGEIDRKAALENRDKPPRRLKETSLGRPPPPTPSGVLSVPVPIEHEEPTTPVEVDAALDPIQLAAWAKRLLEVLHARELVELGNVNLDELTYQLGGLLQAHGLEAEHALETADWLANEIGALRGVDKLFATGGDLQIAIRRSRES